MQKLRIAIAEDDGLVLEYIEEIVRQLGHDVVARAGSGDELVVKCLACRPQVVITDIKMPGLDGVEAAQAICTEHPAYVIFLTGYDEVDRAFEATRTCIRAVFLVKPVDDNCLSIALDFAARRIDEFQNLVSEVGDADGVMRDRDAVELARTWLMQTDDLTDHEAFELLRQEARIRGLRIADTAREIVATINKEEGMSSQ